jgi:hypothetical protein
MRRAMVVADAVVAAAPAPVASAVEAINAAPVDSETVVS